MAGSESFTNWLNEKLLGLKVDETVFSEYICGILEGDESIEEKSEGLNEILSEIIEHDTAELSTLILNKWLECHAAALKEVNTTPRSTLDVNEQLAQLLEAQKLQPAIKERHYTEEERRIKEQILAQYSQTEVVDDDLDDESTEPEKQPASSSDCIERNTNVQDVLALQKERREQARMDSAAKKQKDKDDREKQRQMREEKKEKRKTVKGERRR